MNNRIWFGGGWTLVILSALMRLTADGQGKEPAALQGTQCDVDIYGNIYLLDEEKNTLRLVEAGGRVVVEAGGPGWENGRFDRPSGVWARNGIDVFVADYGNHRIQRFDRQLAFVSSLSTRDSDSPDQRFGYPTDVALSRMGELFICDGENQRIVKVNRLSQVEKVFGGFDAGRGKLQKPTRLAIGPSDNVYVLDEDRIVVFDPFGNFLRELYQKMWRRPSALWADGERVLVADEDTLRCFDKEGRLAQSVALAEIGLQVHGKIRAIGAQNGELYLLSSTGLSATGDPCAVASHIDK
jgi:DNA-binding beta-propeller fold protein YncE